MLVVGAVAFDPEAAVAPVFGAVDEFGAEGIALDVADDFEQVRVALDGEGFVGALVKVAVACGVAVFVPASDVCDGEALHELAELGVGGGLEDQVPVVGHDAVGEELDGDGVEGLGEDFFEGGVVEVFLEEGGAGVGSVEDVKEGVGGGDAGCAGHGGEGSGARRACQKYMDASPF